MANATKRTVVTVLAAGTLASSPPNGRLARLAHYLAKFESLPGRRLVPSAAQGTLRRGQPARTPALRYRLAVARENYGFGPMLIINIPYECGRSEWEMFGTKGRNSELRQVC